ncbi:MAG: substrate-binding domain-containing protein [Akkermansiaceae bacterium]|nr:substrate-binding domain-containing protein [Akkermansiaceae bacterium]
MPRLPQRHSLPAQTAEIILEMISSGELTDTLPGERTLASRLQIGRDTLRAALDILESQKAVSPRTHGQRRSILKKQQGDKAKRTPRIAFLSPKKLQELPPWMLIELDTLRELLNHRGYELEYLSPGVFHIKNPALRLQQLVDDNAFDLWILYQCPLQVQQWFQKNKLASIIRGYSNVGIDIPSIDEDWQASAFHAGGVLTRNGHRSVGLLMPDAKLAGLKATEDGLRRAVEQSNVAGTVHTMIDQAEPGSTQNVLARAFKLKDPPTALVGTRSRHTLSAISWLAQNGLKIPQDISYISLSYEPWYPYLTPTISHYHSDPATFARTVLKKATALLENNKTLPSKLLMPEYYPGGSVQKI